MTIYTNLRREKDESSKREKKPKVVKMISHRTTQNFKQEESKTTIRTYISKHRKQFKPFKTDNKEVFKKDERGRGQGEPQSNTYTTISTITG